ncbi:uncharacterized protein LOC133734024 [Rosa rugosa]|uniref:uncharacterized protein LOC133734024 n=1 Tax=Rosa rugosa TaxID=74645 RepID=UPI002B4131A8|nr:uncharacterized protein LOC133734024 [Rosa rugosa]
MNLLSWNCQGIGNPWTVKGLKGLITLNIPKMIFLSETRCTEEEMDGVRRQIGWKNCFVVECKFVPKKNSKGVSRSGGLALLWEEDVVVDIQSFSDSHIDVVVGEPSDPKRWRFTGFYGQPRPENRHLSWALLKTLSLHGNLPWVVGGDLNEITSTDDKEGGVVRNIRQMMGLRDALDFGLLSDIKFLGPRYTWQGIRGGHLIKIRLDRFVASQSWKNLYSASRVLHLNPSTSDHLLILLEVREHMQTKRRRGRRFRFEELWLREEDCKQIVEQSWESGSGSDAFSKICDKIRRTRSALESWSFDKFRSLTRTIEDTRARDDQIEKIVLDYYRGLFSSSRPVDFQQVLDAIPCVITDDINREITKEVTADEVFGALKQMHPSKAPGPDGFSPCFYQFFWGTVGEDVVEAVRAFLLSEELLRTINCTFVTLIPKVKLPQYVGQLRPISLCNVLYKLGSKVLANRIKPLMDSIISPCQSAFVSGRLISDNSLIAFEIGQFLKRRRSGNKGFCALKLDMSKAYDRVEWRFLELVMLKMGFCSLWVQWIMSCVKTVTYSFLLNGVPRGRLLPERGLRQGDSISPYLFLFCAEALSRLLSLEEEQGRLRGVKICTATPSISHLFFADDSFIFCQAELEDCESVKDILRRYEEASGQQINLQKSSISFSRNVPMSKQEGLADFLGVQRVDKHDKYLGLPMEVSYSKEEAFGYLVERVQKRTHGWKAKLLSAAGKEILIKAVAQAIPSYVMNCFELPRQLCNEMHRLMAQFWWGDVEGKGKVHWLSWDKLCVSKQEGGLGFRDMHDFNLALLAKQGWRLVQRPDALLTQLLKARYFPRSDFMEAELEAGSSYTWRSIMAGRQVLEQGLRFQVGTGQRISVWHDRWVPRPRTFRPYSPPMEGLEELCVADLIDQEDKVWLVDLLNELFIPGEVELIASIPLSTRLVEDRLVWHYDKKGIYNVRSGYFVWRESKKAPVTATTSSAVIGAHVPAKTKVFLWKLLRGILPTRTALADRRVHLPDNRCVFCSNNFETSVHVFKNCDSVETFWVEGPLKLRPKDHAAINLHAWIYGMIDVLHGEQLCMFFMALWSLWNERNKIIWQGGHFNPMFAAQWAVNYLVEFQQVRYKPTVKMKRSVTKWECPPRGRLKINIDGAFRGVDGSGGIGVVVRTAEGVGIAALARPFVHAHSALNMEVEACRAGLFLGIHQGWTDIDIESDSILLIAALQRGG